MKLTNIIPASPTCDLVEIENGQPVTTSLKIAELFGKNHKEVLRDIRDKVVPNVTDDFGQRNFAPSSYQNEQNKRQPMYYLTRDGFTMVAMGYTGPKAMQFKEAYINEFNKMEAMLQKTRPNADDLINQAATKITSKLFPQFVKTVSATLSNDIVEQIRSLPQGEQLLQQPQSVALPEERPQKQYITLYVVLVWDEKDGVQLYKTKDRAKYLNVVKDAVACKKQYTVERIQTVSYK